MQRFNGRNKGLTDAIDIGRSDFPPLHQLVVRLKRARIDPTIVIVEGNIPCCHNFVQLSRGIVQVTVSGWDMFQRECHVFRIKSFREWGWQFTKMRNKEFHPQTGTPNGEPSAGTMHGIDPIQQVLNRWSHRRLSTGQ